MYESIGSTGVVGILKNGDGPTVLMRADMDALPVTEDTGLPYSSTDTGTDETGPEVRVAHACGHDVHVACLLGAAKLMADGKAAWDGTFIALFQPAEELANGARKMIAGGLAGLIPNSMLPWPSTFWHFPPAASAPDRARSSRAQTA